MNWVLSLRYLILEMKVFYYLYNKFNLKNYLLILVGLSILTIFYYGSFNNNFLVLKKQHLLNKFSSKIDPLLKIDRKTIINSALPLSIVNGRNIEYVIKLSGGEGEIFSLNYSVIPPFITEVKSRGLSHIQ